MGRTGEMSHCLFVETFTNNVANRNSIIFYHMIQYIVHMHKVIYKILFGGGDRIC